MSEPGGDPSSGISSGDALILPERHPACRRREARPGFRPSVGCTAPQAAFDPVDPQSPHRQLRHIHFVQDAFSGRGPSDPGLFTMSRGIRADLGGSRSEQVGRLFGMRPPLRMRYPGGRISAHDVSAQFQKSLLTTAIAIGALSVNAVEGRGRTLMFRRISFRTFRGWRRLSTHAGEPLGGFRTPSRALSGSRIRGQILTNLWSGDRPNECHQGDGRQPADQAISRSRGGGAGRQRTTGQVANQTKPSSFPVREWREGGIRALHICQPERHHLRLGHGSDGLYPSDNPGGRL